MRNSLSHIDYNCDLAGPIENPHPGLYASNLRIVCRILGLLPRLTGGNVTWRHANSSEYRPHLATPHSLGDPMTPRAKPLITPYCGQLPASYLCTMVESSTADAGAPCPPFRRSSRTRLVWRASPLTASAAQQRNYVSCGFHPLQPLRYSVTTATNIGEQDLCFVVLPEVGSLLRRGRKCLNCWCFMPLAQKRWQSAMTRLARTIRKTRE